MVNASYPFEKMNDGLTPSGQLVELLKDLAASPNRLQAHANATLEFKEGLARRKEERAERRRKAPPIRRTSTKQLMTAKKGNDISNTWSSAAPSARSEDGAYRGGEAL